MSDVDTSQTQAAAADDADQPPIQTQIKVEEAKVLLHSAGTGTTNVYFGTPAPEPTKSAHLGASAAPRHRTGECLFENLPLLPTNIHPFRDPQHAELREKLEDQRILLLSSYEEDAAYAAADSLAHDEHFGGQARKAFFPTAGRDKDRSDLDLFALIDEQYLGEEPLILLIGIDAHCALLDSALRSMSWIALGRIAQKLHDHRSHVILVVNDALLANHTSSSRITRHSVSHLRYLLEKTGRGDEFERRILSAIDFAADPVRMQDLYHAVTDNVGRGAEAIENFVRELERTHNLPLVPIENRQGVRAQDIFPADSEIHRATAFVATYFPDIGQRDFERLVLTLLAGQSTTVERSRQVVARDGSVTVVREQVEELWSDHWIRNTDRVFTECHLAPVASANGAWLVDFTEQYLRRDLRLHLEKWHPWYVRRQCEALQERGALFALDLSPAAVGALVQLFVERAVVDPGGFNSVWLINLVQGLRIQLDGDPPGTSQEEILAWLLERVTLEAQLRWHFHGRLALLIREMLEREPLRHMVRDFFEFLIAARHHDALLDVVLDLARRLRFAPHFDPLIWMRRLLDQGSAAVRERTAARLIKLARESGPRIYEFLAVVRTWLPDAGRTPERFSMSNRVALEFPFAYCLAVAASLPEDRFGQWPSQHPLFYALPDDPAEARTEIGGLIDWILDPRGAALENVGEEEAKMSAEEMRIAYVADLVEYWAWVLEGALNEGHSCGRALFRVIVEEMNRRLGASERLWLQRSWRRRQDNYVTHAAVAPRPERLRLINRSARLEQIRARFPEVAQTQ